jgi:aminoglycoside/choline kinase family phosphotransferase
MGGSLPKFCPSVRSGYFVRVTPASSAISSPPADLAELVAECLNEPVPRLFRLPGGLSPRLFFRMQRASGEGAIVMWLPEDAPERVLAQRLGRTLPFLELRQLLEAAGVKVPRLFGARPELGLLVVEDLGETLAERLERAPAERAALYRRAVVDLAAAQAALAELPAGCIAATRSFDRQLLTWEIDHFREWGVQALGVTLTEGELSGFERARSYLVETIAGLPQGFVHRDYQSRNLLVGPGGSIAWIDFQDALLGPRAYDLVALLRDSYQAFDEDFVAARLAEFAAARGLGSDEARALGFEFDIITVQRKLKDAGRFVFFERTRGDSSYLQFFVPTLKLVLAALSRLPARAELSGLLALVERQIEIGRSRGMLPP